MAKTYGDERGYKRYSDSGKLVHRHSAEKKLGRNLKSGEVVHHINRNKSDNRGSNLWVCKNQGQHGGFHKDDAEDFGREYSYRGRR